MIAFAIAFATANGNLEILNKEIFASLKSSLELALGLLGSMMLWGGTIKVAEKSGMIKKLGKLIGPIIRLIFHDIPKEGEAIGSITMNITSNMFGLGNAATPMGLKAISELQKLNNNKITASNAMCRFLVINSAPICIMPSTVISIRASLGSNNPGIVILPSIIVSIIAIITGLICCRIFEGKGGIC